MPSTCSTTSARCLILLPTIGPMARLCAWLLPERPQRPTARPNPGTWTRRPWTTPSLALANAARETLRLGDLIDNMLHRHARCAARQANGRSPRRCGSLTDDVEALYSAIKLYLAQMPREDLSDQDSRRWAEIIELAINLKLASDLIERMLRKVQQQKTSQRRPVFRSGPGRARRAAQPVDRQPAPGPCRCSSAPTRKAPANCYARSAAFAPRSAAWPTPM